MLFRFQWYEIVIYVLSVKVCTGMLNYDTEKMWKWFEKYFVKALWDYSCYTMKMIHELFFKSTLRLLVLHYENDLVFMNDNVTRCDKYMLKVGRDHICCDHVLWASFLSDGTTSRHRARLYGPIPMNTQVSGISWYYPLYCHGWSSSCDCVVCHEPEH